MTVTANLRNVYAYKFKFIAGGLVKKGFGYHNRQSDFIDFQHFMFRGYNALEGPTAPFLNRVAASTRNTLLGSQARASLTENIRVRTPVLLKQTTAAFYQGKMFTDKCPVRNTSKASRTATKDMHLGSLKHRIAGVRPKLLGKDLFSIFQEEEEITFYAGKYSFPSMPNSMPNSFSNKTHFLIKMIAELLIGKLKKLDIVDQSFYQTSLLKEYKSFLDRLGAQANTIRVRTPVSRKQTTAAFYQEKLLTNKCPERNTSEASRTAMNNIHVESLQHEVAGVRSKLLWKDLFSIFQEKEVITDYARKYSFPSWHTKLSYKPPFLIKTIAQLLVVGLQKLDVVDQSCYQTSLLKENESLLDRLGAQASATLAEYIRVRTPVSREQTTAFYLSMHVCHSTEPELYYDEHLKGNLGKVYARQSKENWQSSFGSNAGIVLVQNWLKPKPPLYGAIPTILLLESKQHRARHERKWWTNAPH